MFILGVSAWVAVAAAILGLILFVSWYRRAADYPGAVRMAEQTVFKYSPSLSVRSDTSYRSSDEVPAIYNWYSNGFKLGTEAHAQSGCIQLAKSFTDLGVIERYMSVMMCDTPHGRMIFVMRSLYLRRP